MIVNSNVLHGVLRPRQDQDVRVLRPRHSQDMVYWDQDKAWGIEPKVRPRLGDISTKSWGIGTSKRPGLGVLRPRH